MTPIVDAHLDLAWNALSWDRDLTCSLHEVRRNERQMVDHPARGRGTVSLPELREAGVVVAVATLLARAKPKVRPAAGFKRVDLDHPTQDIAYAVAQGQLAYYKHLEASNEIQLLRTRTDLDNHLSSWNAAPDRAAMPVGVILSMEGADPIVSPSQVGQWWNDGLRIVGLAHYGEGCYAMGTGGAGPLTAAGRKLVCELEARGFALDLTHCAEPGFFEALDRFAGVVLASHNNCRKLVPGDRQFSDEQLHALVARDAVIGVAFDAWMLYPGWQIHQSSREVVSLEAVCDHIDHICQRAGSCRHVGIGSDLDGGFGTEQVPRGLDTYRDVRLVDEILGRRGYSETDIGAIMGGNWTRLLRRVLPAAVIQDEKA